MLNSKESYLEEMSRRKRNLFRLAGRIILGFVALILLISLAFYLGRSWIMGRAVTYLNKQQPGEVQMGRMNLIPFMNFPNVSLQLRNVSYYEKKVYPDSLLQEPILSLREVFVTLDVVDLIKGEFQVSRASMQDGFVRLEVYEDSVTNLEYALGIRFGSGTETDTTNEMTTLSVNLERMNLSNIQVILRDRTKDDDLNLTVNRLESNFSYLSDHMQAGIKLDLDINKLKYLTYKSETKRNIYFESDIIADPLLKKIEVEPSSLKISGLELETWGNYSYSGQPHVDFAFRARNEGLEVLNYLFRGVLDLDEIEQIGSGSITLSGNVSGFLGDQLPVIRLNGTADRIGFRIKSIGKDVTDISFKVYGTNGRKLDYSEGLLLVEGFTATFPEGTLNGSMLVKNMNIPEVKIELSGDVNLAGLERMIKTESFSELEGIMSLEGSLEGVVNRNSGEFLNDAGSVRAELYDVGFVVRRDSGKFDRIRQLNGALFLEGNLVGARNLSFDLNGDRFLMQASTENLLLYLLGYDRDVIGEITMDSELLHPATLLGDTVLASELGNEWKGLHFGAGIMIAARELDAFLEEDSIPRMNFTLDSFGIEMPLYPAVSNLNVSLTLDPDSLMIHYLQGTVGETRVNLAGTVENYAALSRHDSTGMIGASFRISSDSLRAEDLLALNTGIMLPEPYLKEYLKDFHMDGSVELPVAGLMYDTAVLDFGIRIEDLGWSLKYYPFPFKDFRLRASRHGNRLIIDNFQGTVGENNLKMTATLNNFTDSLIGNMSGNMWVASDLIDLNELMNYTLPGTVLDTSGLDSSEVQEPIRLDEIDYPDFELTMDIGELRYEQYKIFGLSGSVRSSTNRILYLDRFGIKTESGGKMEFSGQFNVSNPRYYTFSSEVNLEGVDITDLDFEMQSGDEIYTLKENFRGVISAKGLVEISLKPDLTFDIPASTSVFNVSVANGALINFTPLRAAAKYLDNKDLNHVKFNTLQTPYSFTLVDSRIIIPLMNVESSVGQMFIEGEQGLDGSYLYLLRLPTKLVKGAARSVLGNTGQGQEEDQIQEMKSGNFMNLTVWGEGDESEVKIGNRRDKYK